MPQPSYFHEKFPYYLLGMRLSKPKDWCQCFWKEKKSLWLCWESDRDTLVIQSNYYTYWAEYSIQMMYVVKVKLLN
jgi:hypothetical protein